MKWSTSQAFLSILHGSMNSGSSVEMATKRDTSPGTALPLEGPRILPIRSLSGNKLLGILQQDWSKKNAPAFRGHFLFPGTSAQHAPV
jgi:hypothetical protein